MVGDGAIRMFDGLMAVSNNMLSPFTRNLGDREHPILGEWVELGSIWCHIDFLHIYNRFRTNIDRYRQTHVYSRTDS